MGFLGLYSRGVQRKALHCLLKGSTVSSSSHLSSKGTTYYPEVHHSQNSPYEHHDHGDHGKHLSKPISKYGYRRSPVPLSASLKTTLIAPPRVQNIVRRYSTVAASGDKKKVAVVLSGCGVLDGSEIHEAVSVLVHLSRAGVETRMFAPDIEQSDVINHVKGAAAGDGTRNVLVEAARIARGKVKPLSALEVDSYSAVIFPGGYGAAKNLCNFARQGENLTVNPDVEKVIKAFHEAKKPIGMLCVSPVIAAKLIPGVSITLGNEDKDIQAVMQKIGAKPIPLGVNEVAVDEEHNVISSPAYMTNSPIHKVFDGIGKFVETVLARTGPAAEHKKPETKS